jgi:hypothetical protein
MLEPIEDGLLLRADGWQRIGQLLGAKGFNEYRLSGAGVLAHACRHHRVQHLPPAAQIIVRDPAGQLHEVIVHECLVVEHADDRLDGSSRCLGSDADAEAGRGAITFSERRLDSLAHGDMGRQPVRHGVGIGMVHGTIEDDLREERRRLRRGVDFEFVFEREK